MPSCSETRRRSYFYIYIELSIAGDGYKYQFINDPVFQRIVETDLLTGNHENPYDTPNYFTTAFFHTPSLIMQELQQTGFQDIRLFAVEGFASIIDTDGIMQVEDKKALLLKYLRLTEEFPELLGISSHLLAVARKA